MIVLKTFEELENLVSSRKNENSIVFVTSDSCMVCHSILKEIKESPEITAKLDKVYNFEFSPSCASSWVKNEITKKITTVPAVFRIKDSGETTGSTIVKVESLNQLLTFIKSSN